jgi:hypothetical protein
MSINNITYLDQFYRSEIFTIRNPEIMNLYNIDWLEIVYFLKLLSENKVKY